MNNVNDYVMASSYPRVGKPTLFIFKLKNFPSHESLFDALFVKNIKVTFKRVPGSVKFGMKSEPF